jgi:arsenate reductase
VRKNEAIWKEQFKAKTLSDAAIILAMIQYPKLMERPIVVHGNKAVIGRPPSRVLEII